MKAMKKVLFLTLVMVLALAATAFAADVTTVLSADDIAGEENAWYVAKTGNTQCFFGNSENDGMHEEAVITKTVTGLENYDCTEDVVITVTCSACSEKGTMIYTIKGAEGHTWGDVEKVNAVIGHKATIKTEDATEYVTGWAETETAGNAVASTATAIGTDIYTNECQKCGIVIWWEKPAAPADDYVAPHEHVYTKLGNVVGDQTTATCSKDGVVTYELLCSVDGCTASYGTTTKTTKAYGHDGLIDEAYNAAGLVKNAAMDNPKAASFAAELNKISAANGNHLNAVVTNATCGKDGKLVVTCNECVAGKQTPVLTIVLPATGEHTWELEVIKERATCTKNGLAVYTCACGASKNEVINAAGHNYQKAVMMDGEIIPASMMDFEQFIARNIPGCKEYTIVEYCCETAGVEENENSVTITYCNDVKIVKNVPARWNHEDVTVENYKNLIAAGQFTEFAKSEGNCTNEAYIVVKCAGPACEYVKKLVLKEAGHEWQAINHETSKVQKAATCTAEGEMIVQCKNYENCKATTIMTIEKKEHVPYETLQDATNCTTEGKITIKCNVCQTLIKEDIIPAGHVILDGVRANCTRVNGKLVITDCTKVATEKGYCVRCELANQTNTYAAKAAHTKAEKLVENENYYVEREATCQQTGLTYYDCAACKQENCIEEITPVTAHFSSKNDPIFVAELKAATCTAEGTKLVRCADDTHCTETKEAPIAKIPHSFEYKNNKLVCSVCGATEDMVDGHDYKVDTKNVNMTSTSTSGIGQITSKDAAGNIDHTLTLYARINFGYKLDNGEAVAYVACVPVAEDGTFRMASPSCPYGATLTNVTVMITTAENAQDMLIADVPNCGVTVLR